MITRQGKDWQQLFNLYGDDMEDARSFAPNKIRLMNGTLCRYGFAQRAPGVAPTWDAAKVVLHDVGQAALAPLRKSERLRALLRGMIYGRKANYYLAAKKQGM